MKIGRLQYHAIICQIMHLGILYGDGDKYSAFADIDTDSISWVLLIATSAAERTGGVVSERMR